MDGSKVNWKTGAVTDSSGRGNTGTTVGMATSTGVGAGKIGQALNFDGSNDFVNVADSPFDFTGDFSISAWVYPENIAAGLHIVSKYEAGAYALTTSEAGFASKFNFVVRDGTSAKFAATNNVGNNNTWHHLVGAVSGTSVKLYLDGVLQTTQGTLVSAVSTTNYPLSIGVNPGATYANFFDGRIDEVRVYNRALSANEVNRLYNMGR